MTYAESSKLSYPGGNAKGNQFQVTLALSPCVQLSMPKQPTLLLPLPIFRIFSGKHKAELVW